MSSSEMMTEKCASQPRSVPSWALAMSARGFVSAEIASAMSTSSECRRGLWWPSDWILSAEIGSMT